MKELSLEEQIKIINATQKNQITIIRNTRVYLDFQYKTEIFTMYPNPLRIYLKNKVLYTESISEMIRQLDETI
jgi:hypothetical protein